MTEEDKKILKADLCGRLPYGVRGVVPAAATDPHRYDMDGFPEEYMFNADVELDMIDAANDEIFVSVFTDDEGLSEYIYLCQTDGVPWTIGEFKPYLRSMSNMTEDEKSEFETLKQMSVTVVMPNGVNRSKPSYIVDLDDDGDGLNILYDWLNINHFDFRGLIKKGLAVEAPDGIYRKSNNNK
jgi:hypothetical protein